MPSIKKEPIYDVFCISRRQYQSYLNILFRGCLSGAVMVLGVLSGVVMVVGSILIRGKIFTASFCSFDSLYLSVFISCMNLHQVLILCSLKAMMFVKLYFRTSDIYLISLVSLDPSGFYLRTKWMPSIEKEPIYDVYCISRRQYQRYLNIRIWGCLIGAVGSVDVLCISRRSCHGRWFESRGKIITASIG